MPDDAIQAISDAAFAGTSLLGLDSAYLREATIRPSLEDSWDYSSPAYPAVPNRDAHAIQFIREGRSKRLRFELMLAKALPSGPTTIWMVVGPLGI